MSGHDLVPLVEELTRQIPDTTDRLELGRVLVKAKPLVLATGQTWGAYLAANGIGERRAQRAMAAVAEKNATDSRRAIETPVDILLREQGALPTPEATVSGDVGPDAHDGEAPTPDVAEPLPVQEEADTEPSVAAPVLQVVHDIADTWEEPVGHPTTEPAPTVAEPDPPTVDEQDVAEFDVVYTEVAEPPATAPEPSPIPHAAQAIANAYLALPPGRWRGECLKWVEAGCPGDWMYFIADLQAREATLELRHEAAYYTNDQTRQAFARWARSLELGSARS